MSSAVAQKIETDIESRARCSQGISDVSIYQMVADVLKQREGTVGVLLDVGCGSGQLWSYVNSYFTRYIGVDVVRYEGLPSEAEFHQVNLDFGTGLPDDYADVVVAVETIEHLENPRAFMRELVRLVKPGGLVVVTTPNQLSLLSLLTLVVKKRFSSFQDVHYPAHLMALLEVDLERIAAACSMREVNIKYSQQGRIVLTSRHYPRWLARLFPRTLSDNLLLMGKKLELRQG